MRRNLQELQCLHKPELSEESSLQPSLPQNEKAALIAGKRKREQSTHAEIHRQAAPKCAMFSIALLLLDSTIEAFCTACARCTRASKRRKKLSLDINPASQKELLHPRPRYGIYFYGVHNEEILGKVGLFSRETKLKFLPDRKMKRG